MIVELVVVAPPGTACVSDLPLYSGVFGRESKEWSDSRPETARITEAGLGEGTGSKGEVER